MNKAAFECHMCGHCCHGEGGIIMSQKDRKRLAAHLGLEVQEMLDKYAQLTNGKYNLRTGDDGYCIFYENGCGVHPGRPDICRAWPFFRGNLVDSLSWEMIQEYCPGVNPDAGHDVFVCQGKEYLRRENILRYDPDVDPNALLSEDETL